MATVCERITALREKMKENGITVYVVPSTDCHESEYVCPHYRARAYITGFTGSAGTAVITMDKAGLWTDGRYFLQAEDQLRGTGIHLFRMGEPGVPTVEEYVKTELCAGGCVGFDGKTMGAVSADKFRESTMEKGGSIYTEKDLVGEIWPDRPQIPDEKVWILEKCWSGESSESKITKVREVMKRAGATQHVIASLCDIMWLLNLRGDDIPCVPVTLSFLRMTDKNCIWYVRPSVVTKEVRSYLAECQVEIRPYESIYEDLSALPAGARVLLDKKNVNCALLTSIPTEVEILDEANPSELLKAVKNETQIKNLKEAHRKESVAFTRFMYWLKTAVGKENMTELSVADYLEARRAEQEHYVEQSFAPICAYGSHGAIVHYSATEESNVSVEPKSFLLVDAGGHYLEGTTDTTRTFAMGELTYEEKHLYTAVCRGNLHLAHARFLHGCTGLNLDILCREPMWKLGLDFKHGTGHGVGYILNVHEGPNAFRWKQSPSLSNAVLEPGMVTTDEPGLYLTGKFGIRLENELVCKKLTDNEYGTFLGFEILTMIPFDLDVVLPEEMSEEERQWLNEYHQKVYETVAESLPEKERIWLREATRQI